MYKGLEGDVLELLRDGEDDWVPIDNLIAYAWEHSIEEEVDPKQGSVALLRFVLENDLMRIGDLGAEGVLPWRMSVNESVGRFLDGCERYRWEPQGALWWLDITERGRSWLREKERG